MPIGDYDKPPRGQDAETQRRTDAKKKTGSLGSLFIVLLFSWRSLRLGALAVIAIIIDKLLGRLSRFPGGNRAS